MEFIKWIIDFILHIDVHLDVITKDYGTLTYVILFVIIFAETGLVVTPFLPGDSLLFAIGAIAARGTLDVFLIFFLLAIAAVLGDTVNYWVGKFLEPKLETIRFINKDHLKKTQDFYDKYGGKTIIIGRFIPIVRTFAPFVAGIGTMNYSKFIIYNVIGGFLWVTIFLTAGYFAEDIAGYLVGDPNAVRKNFSFVIFGIIIISVMPAVIEYFRNTKKVA